VPKTAAFDAILHADRCCADRFLADRFLADRPSLTGSSLAASPGTSHRLPATGSLRTWECGTRDRQCRTRHHERRHLHRQNTARTHQCSIHDHERSAPDSIIRPFVRANAAFDTTNHAFVHTTQLPCPQSCGGTPAVVELVNTSKLPGIKRIQNRPARG